MINFSNLFKLLKKHTNFIITSHVNPDPDAIGSEIAISGILTQLKKEFKIINTSETPYNMLFLDPNNQIEYFDNDKHQSIFQTYEAAIVLDLNHLSRTARMEKSFRKFKGEIICIDHHTNPENFTKHNFIDEGKSSTGEIIFDLINSSDEIKLNKNIATAIYSAIMTDTGSFRFNKTTSEVHIKTAQLLELGLNPDLIYNKIYSQYEFSRNKMLGNALSSIEITDSGKISYMIVTQKNLKKYKGIEADVDGFVNYALNTKNVKIGILFFELEDGVKISYRSRGTIPVNLLAAKFNGGGHVNASGSRLFNVKLDTIIPKVINEAEKILKKYDEN